ncbi:DUF917 domain-containing protein [Nocardia terpenica]|uniref:DUF917 domain-containing protein n=1 Tax=Nocardia terpenica TaxID=455432 RepID=UPI001895F2A4|nr:DUF917 domain-containing protein [Nocardia terpenica]MBF6060011.1 DUF917 domain-containing protein [Nocardia terpenica]MBF6102448.1 DUF917 domain-containing protein [Nocardia terpenica]MBF6111361.1 DUF917 domain-containing protein [Nocardia terpenica]MBF6117492.1 DUF917 domain-containing protein [Nocardia terpenica]MBF6150667.1 DUF917 domain-containing protein [Nocardia terpenica]
MGTELKAEDLPDLARGAALLGTGGGGDPYLGRMLVQQEYLRGRTVELVDPDEIADDALVIPTAGMGAPTVRIEKLPRGTEAALALRTLERHLGRRADATMPIECGGSNSMVPLLVGAQLGLPVVDADGMGRAFPELQMLTFAVYGIPGSPMAFSGSHDEHGIIDTGADNHRLERIARGVTVRLGGTANIAHYSMTGADVRRTAIRHTLTLSLRVGRCLRESRERHRDPLQALTALFKETIYGYAAPVFTGRIFDVERRTVGGFARGRALIRSFADRSVLELSFQNEHLLARVDGRVRVVVPDLITVLNAETAEPITTEALRFGQRVTIYAISAPPIMRTPAALAVFGPRAFGFDLDFEPVEELA